MKYYFKLLTKVKFYFTASGAAARIVTATRRLRALPASSPLDATGWFAACPTAVRRCAAKEAVRQVAEADARDARAQLASAKAEVRLVD